MKRSSPARWPHTRQETDTIPSRRAATDISHSHRTAWIGRGQLLCRDTSASRGSLKDRRKSLVVNVPDQIDRRAWQRTVPREVSLFVPFSLLVSSTARLSPFFGNICRMCQNILLYCFVGAPLRSYLSLAE
jgi:hypothetical protein